jgi:hypothetical protein
MLETFTDKDKVLVRYLFNELDDAEIVDLEDEMLLDDELLERAQVVEMSLIDGYVRNELTGEESLRFTEKFLAVPANRDKVESAQRFHESLRLLHEKEQFAPSALQEQGRHRGFAGFFQMISPAIAFATAALLLTAALIVVFTLQRRSGSSTIVTLNAPPTVSNNMNPGANTAPGRPVAEVTPPPPQQSSANQSPNKQPDRSGDVIAKNYPNNHTQWVCLSCQDRRSGERSGGEAVVISLGKNVKHLSLAYELLGDAPVRATYSVTIKNKYHNLIKLKNNKYIEEIKPVLWKRRKFVVVNVPINALKDSGSYSFEFEDISIASKSFTIKN